MRRRLLLILPPCVALVDAYLPSPHAGFRQRRRFLSQFSQRLQSNRVPEDNNDVQSLMRALGTSPRRIFLSILSGTGIALSGNFLGITSTLLTTIRKMLLRSRAWIYTFPVENKNVVAVAYIRLLCHLNG